MEENNKHEEGIISIEEQLKNSEDKYIRLYAEFENFRKRAQKEKEDLVSNTKVKMLQSILDIDNDLAIAVKNIEDEGVKLIISKLSSFLKAQGIEEIQTEFYDENIHEVISIMETGESKILDVISKGYTLNGNPFRYPKVILSK
jgi:molecular chaperone GrpE